MFEEYRDIPSRLGDYHVVKDNNVHWAKFQIFQFKTFKDKITHEITRVVKQEGDNYVGPVKLMRYCSSTKEFQVKLPFKISDRTFEFSDPWIALDCIKEKIE